MMSGARNLVAAVTGPPESAAMQIGGSVSWVGLLAGMIACGVPLAEGLATGWTPGRTIGYGALALLYLGLTRVHTAPLRIARWLQRQLWAYLLVAGLVCLALQTVSGEPSIQPMAFAVPLISAALNYTALRTVLVAAFYLGLMVLGIWLSGLRSPDALLFPLIGYGVLMALVYVFARLVIEQTAARRRADDLAADLARQRDYLARLSQITATLTRDLDVATVLEQVAAAGRALAYAGQSRVWLRDHANDEDADAPLRLAASLSSQPVQPPSTPDHQRSLLVAHARTDGATLLLPLVFNSVHIGVLELRDPLVAPFSEADVRLLQPFADATAVAIENARLYEQARLSATLAERNRLARELHDTIAQGLTAVTMQLEAAQRSFERDPGRARARLGRAHELARQSLEDVRRSVWTLAAPLIDGQALSQALDELTQRFAARTGITASYSHSGPAPTIGHTAATQVLRVVQEALQNVEKHAQATRICVESALDEVQLRVQVRDDGVGFDPGAPQRTDISGGFGLLSLRERARLAGGTLQVESAPGAGTRVTVAISVKRKM
jgi:signal transduction histidine kinase